MERTADLAVVSLIFALMLPTLAGSQLAGPSTGARSKTAPRPATRLAAALAAVAICQPGRYAPVQSAECRLLDDGQSLLRRGLFSGSRSVGAVAEEAATAQLTSTVGPGAARVSDPMRGADVPHMIGMPDVPPASDQQKLFISASIVIDCAATPDLSLPERRHVTVTGPAD